MKTRKPFYRNPVAQSPLLRKGGAHQVSKSGQRGRSRMALSSALDEWFEDYNDETNSGDKNGEQSSPYSFWLNGFC